MAVAHRIRGSRKGDTIAALARFAVTVCGGCAEGGTTPQQLWYGCLCSLSLTNSVDVSTSYSVCRPGRGVGVGSSDVHDGQLWVGCAAFTSHQRYRCQILGGCSKIAEAEAALSVNEKKWLQVHRHVQLKLDELRGPPNPWLTVT